jgi:hypothetical protein
VDDLLPDLLDGRLVPPGTDEAVGVISIPYQWRAEAQARMSFLGLLLVMPERGRQEERR